MEEAALMFQELAYSDSPPVEWNGRYQPAQSNSFALVELSNLQVQESAWRAVVEKRLNELLKLRKGWDGHNSGPVSSATATFARAILRSVMTDETPPPALVPANGGALQLEWHQQGLDIELMIYRATDAELTVHFHDGRPSIEEQSLTTDFQVLSGVLEELI